MNALIATYWKQLEPLRAGKPACAPLPSSAVVFPLREEERGKSSGVEAALTRIEEGTSGRCDRCGELIDRERLLAVQQTGRCLADRSVGGAPRSDGTDDRGREPEVT